VATSQHDSAVEHRAQELMADESPEGRPAPADHGATVAIMGTVFFLVVLGVSIGIGVAFGVTAGVAIAGLLLLFLIFMPTFWAGVLRSREHRTAHEHAERQMPATPSDLPPRTSAPPSSAAGSPGSSATS
jgi:hypothetical protein